MTVGLAFGAGPGAAAEPSGWGTGTLLEMSDLGLAYNVRVATGGAGVAIYTWTQTVGAVDAIHARRLDLAFGWGETSLIQTDLSAPGDQAFPVMDAAGNAVVTWVSYGTPQQVWAARFDAGAGWGAAARIDAGTDNADRARPAIDAAGNVVVVWQQSDGFKNDMWANRYVVGSGWGTATRIESGDGGAVQPSVSSDAAGNAMAVWAQTDAGVRKVTTNRFAVGTGWGAASFLETATTGNATLPYIDVAHDGHAVAVWTKSDGTRTSTWSAFYSTAGGWGSPGLVENDDSTDANVSGVAVDDGGHAIAAFLRCAATCAPWVARSSAPGSWEAPMAIPWIGGDKALQPRLDMNRRGDAAVVWPAESGGRWDIWGMLYTPTGGWNTAGRIETDNRGNATTASVAMDEKGNAFAAWDDYNGLVANAWSNVYRAAVPPDTTTQDRIDALEDRLAEQDIALQKADNDLDAANDNVVAMAGQLATLSIVATVALLAAIAGMGVTVVQLRRAGRTSPAEVPAKEK